MSPLVSRRGLARAAAAIAGVTIAARVVGFLRVAVFARAVGTNPLGDTYQTANALPNLVFEVVAGGALAAAVVPVVAGAVERADRERARQVTAALVTWVVLLLTPVALLGMAFARPLTEALVGATADPALRAAKVDAGTRMLLVFLPQIVLYGVGVVLTGVLQAHGRFLGPALAPLLSSVVVIGSYVAFAVVAGDATLATVTRGEELLLALGTTAGVVVLSLSLLVPLRSLGLGLRPSLALPDGVARTVLRLGGAGLAGVAAQQVFLAVALRLTNAEPGAVVVHQIAFAVFLLPWAVLAVPIATAAFPAMAAAHDTGDEEAYASVAAGAVRAVVLATTLAAAVLAAAAWPAGWAVSGSRGDAVPRAVVAFAPGLVGYGLVAVLTRALYARQRARDVAVATSAAFVVASAAAVVLASWLPRADRVVAVGAAFSVGVTAGAVLLVAAVRRAAGPVVLAGVRRTALVAVPAALVAYVVGATVADGIGPLLGVVAVPVLTFGVYATVINLAHLPAAAEVRSMLRRAG